MKTLILVMVLIMNIFGTEKVLTNQNEVEIIESSIIEITNNEFYEEVIESDKKVLLDFSASWCKPCQRLLPIIEEIAAENKEIKVIKIDIDKEKSLAENYNVNSIPTLIVIENGKEINRVSGGVSKEYINNMINDSSY